MWKAIWLTVVLLVRTQAVSRPPAIFLEPDYDVFFKAGETVQLPCKADGEPKPSYQWNKNEIFFNPIGSGDRIIQLPDAGTLVINMPEDKDEGIFQCFAHNELGLSASKKIKLRQARLLNFTYDRPTIHKPQLGKPYTLFCVPPESVPPPAVFWTTKDASGSFNFINYDDRISVDREYRLRITNVKAIDRKNGLPYLCMAVNNFMRKISQGPLHYIEPQGIVEDYMPVSYLWADNADRFGLLGSNFSVKCIFAGNPTPDVHWERTDNKTMSDRVNTQGFSQEMIITNLQFQDAGTYECWATNFVSQGILYRTFNIRVNAKPYFLQAPRDIDINEGATVEFTCIAGGIPEPIIEWFVNGVSLRDVKDPRITGPRFKHPVENKIILENVEMTDSMVFQCNASNIYGYVFADVYLNVFADVYMNHLSPVSTLLPGNSTAVLLTNPVTPPPCLDTMDNCTSYSTSECIAFAPFFSERCAQMCGLCDINAETSGFHGMCMYKSKIYGQGVKWFDGCDYECVCTDATHGKYDCVSQCDVYHNLPPYCTLVQKEGECCLQPVCHFSSIVHTYSLTFLGLSPDGHDVCSYQGQQYAQNQFIDNACVSQCICANASLGTINCTATCPQYDPAILPEFCYLESVPDSCCKQPKCKLQTASAIVTGFGTVSDKAGYKEIYNESMQPPCIDLKPECPLYGKDACEGNYRPFMTENCPVYCGLCHIKYPGFVAGPEDRCIYNGVQYKAGDVWEPDCEHQCTCDTQYYGYYRCWSRCPTYTQIPTECKLEKLVSDCCARISCPYNTVIIPSTTNLLGLPAGTNIYVTSSNGQQNPLLPVLNLDGSVNTTAYAYQTFSVLGCLFNGRILAEGEVSKDPKCGSTCQCLNENMGLMACIPRCPSYTTMSDQCTFVTDQLDACCKVPNCPLGVSPPKPTYSSAMYVYAVVKGIEPQVLLSMTSSAGTTFTNSGTSTPPLTPVLDAT